MKSIKSYLLFCCAIWLMGCSTPEQKNSQLVNKTKTTVTNTINNQEKKDVVIGHKRSFYSSILGEQRDFYVSLPPNYDASIHDYPVIYVMDAEYLFDLTQSIVKIRASRNYMPHSIVVGVVNNTGKRNDMALILKNEEGREFFGGYGGKSKEHLDFLKKEVIPFFESEYRINDHRTIIGMSPTFGPVLEAFWNDPTFFKGYIVLASELAQFTNNGHTVGDQILAAVKSGQHSGNSLYIGKAADDLLRRPLSETRAYPVLNKSLEALDLENFRYKIEVLEGEDHYGMSISGIQHGLETLYPRDIWNISYSSFWKANKPATAIKDYFDKLSALYRFEIIPNEDSFYFIGNLLGVGRRLKNGKRYAERVEVLELAAVYYPKSSKVYKSLADAYKDINETQKSLLASKKAKQLDENWNVKPYGD